MIQQTHQPLYFFAQFTSGKIGKTGLASGQSPMTVDVYDNSNAKIVPDGAAVEVANGVYRYTVANPTTGGAWTAIFKTSDLTVDLQHLPSLQLVGVAGVNNLDAAISGVPSAVANYNQGDDSLFVILSDALTASQAAKTSADAILQPAGKNAIADALLNRADGILAGFTPKQALQLLVHGLRSADVTPPVGDTPGTVVFKKPDGTTAFTWQYNAEGDRVFVLGTL